MTAANRTLMSIVLVVLCVCTENSNGEGVIISVSNPSGLQGTAFGFSSSAAQFFDTNDHSNANLVYDQTSGNLNAFHIRENGNFLVSTTVGLVSGASSFDDGEIVEIDPNTLDATSFINFELILDSSNDIDIDAIVELPDGRVAFSTLNDGTVDVGPNSGLAFTKNDIVVYDDTDMSAQILFSGSLITGGDNFNNLTGLDILEDGKIAFSVSTGGVTDIVVGGATFQRNDAILYDPSTDTASILIEGSNVFEGPPNPSIDALHLFEAVPEPSTLGLIALSTMCVGPFFRHRRQK